MANGNGGKVALIVIGAGLLLSSGAQLGRFATQRSDIWWTPLALAVPLAEAGERVEVYVRGTHIGVLAREGRLQMTEPAGRTTVTEADVGFRFNNWDRMRAQRARVVGLAGFGAGVGVVFLAFGLLGFRRGP